MFDPLFDHDLPAKEEMQRQSEPGPRGSFVKRVVPAIRSPPHFLLLSTTQEVLARFRTNLISPVLGPLIAQKACTNIVNFKPSAWPLRTTKWLAHLQRHPRKH